MPSAVPASQAANLGSDVHAIPRKCRPPKSEDAHCCTNAMKHFSRGNRCFADARDALTKTSDRALDFGKFGPMPEGFWTLFQSGPAPHLCHLARSGGANPACSQSVFCLTKRNSLLNFVIAMEHLGRNFTGF